MNINSVTKKILSHSHECKCEECTSGHPHEGHEHEHEHSFDRVILVRLIVSAVLFILGLVLPVKEFISGILMVLAALVAGYDVYLGAVKNIIEKHIFDECLLMSIASLAAFVIGEFHEGSAVMILFQLGELLQSYAVGKTRKSVTELMDLRPDVATVIRDGVEVSVPIKEIVVGDTILVKPGERFAVDCIVSSGSSTLDMSALTGESMPVSVSQDTPIMSGSINLDSPIYAEATAIASESTATRILDLVRSESEKKGSTERFISKFARIYTPCVLALALIVMLVLPLATEITLAESIHRGLVFLVISCPCALVISVPLAYFAGIGGASKLGILFKNSAAMDAVAKTKAVVFDKTGTLTTGKYKVTAIYPRHMDADMLLKVAAHVEAYSNHPIGKAIVAAYNKPIYIEVIQNFTETPGMGVTATVNGVDIKAGNKEFIRSSEGFEAYAHDDGYSVVYFSVGGKFAGYISLGDTVKADAAEAIMQLSELSSDNITMLTGDNRETSERFANTLGIKEFYSQCLPDDKVAKVQEIKSRLGSHETLLFVGDGMNDAPVITSADVGIAMGGLGSDSAIEAADVVIMDDKPTKVTLAIHAARETRKVLFQNIAFILAVKLIVLVLGIFGISAMWTAVFADVGVAILASINSMRAYYIKPFDN